MICPECSEVIGVVTILDGNWRAEISHGGNWWVGAGLTVTDALTELAVELARSIAVYHHTAGRI